jgi:hypothetical protein
MEQLTENGRKAEQWLDALAYQELARRCGLGTKHAPELHLLFTYSIEIDHNGERSFTFKRRSYTPRPR